MILFSWERCGLPVASSSRHASARSSSVGALGCLLLAGLCTDNGSESHCLEFLCGPGVSLLALLLGSRALPRAPWELRAFQDDQQLDNASRVHVLLLGKHIIVSLLVANHSGFFLFLALRVSPAKRSFNPRQTGVVGHPRTYGPKEPHLGLLPQCHISRLFGCESNISVHAHQTWGLMPSLPCEAQGAPTLGLSCRGYTSPVTQAPP